MSDRPGRSQASRRVVPVPGSEAALSALRDDIARLEAELHELEQRTAELERGDTPRPAEVVGPISAQMAEDLSTVSVEQERADMGRFLDGTLAVCEARMAEARSEARAMLDVARDELALAVRERAALVEEVIASPPVPLDAAVPHASVGVEAEHQPGAEDAEDAEVDAAAEGVSSVVEDVASVETAPLVAVGEAIERVDAVEVDPPVATGTPVAAGRRRESVMSLLMWILGGALVVVGVAFGINLILMFLG